MKNLDLILFFGFLFLINGFAWINTTYIHPTVTLTNKDVLVDCDRDGVADEKYHYVKGGVMGPGKFAYYYFPGGHITKEDQKEFEAASIN